MSTEIINLIFILLSGALQAEAELIRFNPHLSLFNKAPWWKDNNWKYDSKFLEIFMRYLGSLGKDGFHFTKSLSIIFHAIVLGLSIITCFDLETYIELSGNQYHYFFLVVTVYYIIYGIGFNLRFHWAKWYTKIKNIF